MSNLLERGSLNWAYLDEQGLCAVYVRDLLLRWNSQPSSAGALAPRIHLTNHLNDWSTADSQQQFLKSLAHGEVSLLSVHVGASHQLEPTCKLLAQLEKTPWRMFRLCYLAPELADWTPILAEAGAQIIVSQLTCIKPALERILPSLSFSNKGFHPLTSGLMERLPWRHLA